MMQVGLSMNALKDNEPFYRASYGFGIFYISRPIEIIALIVLVLLPVALSN